MPGLLSLTATVFAATSGTLTFDGFQHQPTGTLNRTNYQEFSFAAGWFPNPEVAIADKHLVLGSNSTFVARQDLAPFTFDSFDYWSRGGDGGVAYLVLYGSNFQPVFNGVLNNDGRLQFKTGTHTTFNNTVWSNPVYGFAFAFDQSGGGNGDSGDWARFGFDNLKFSGATTVAAPIPAVPEPHVFLMLLAGLGVISLKARRVSNAKTSQI